ncbi:shikimate dehydrogenase [Anaerophilus nitritogenes]|uniref:shikimate dehydrogenase n=1 Tax=Anaerophilus nitritogenes TaxID=2498136 RepID=UPI00101B9EDE|nr:shikimate dehydrogenase [Anaerophilus nitritogenes]
MDQYGLIGEKLTHSFSPLIHKIILKELNKEGPYNLFEIQKRHLKDEIEKFKIANIKGVNVTIPYKTDIMPYLDHISDEAMRIGAVNTLDFKDSKIIGYNTDYYGFGRMLDRNHVEIKNKKAVILGTGGASKAVNTYLLDHGIKEIVFVSRGVRKEKLDINCISYDEVDTLKEYEIVINCTPCGMYPHIEASPLKKETILKFETAIDLIYNPLETLFLNNAKEGNLKTINGLYMLVGQAVASQEIWNGINIDPNICDLIYNKVLGGLSL